MAVKPNNQNCLDLLINWYPDNHRYCHVFTNQHPMASLRVRILLEQPFQVEQVCSWGSRSQDRAAAGPGLGPGFARSLAMGSWEISSPSLCLSLLIRRRRG